MHVIGDNKFHLDFIIMTLFVALLKTDVKQILIIIHHSQLYR